MLARDGVNEDVVGHNLGRTSGGAGVTKWIKDLRAALLNKTVGDGIVIPDLVIHFRRNTEELITDAGVNGDLLVHLPGILREAGVVIRIEQAVEVGLLVQRVVERRSAE